MSITLLWQLERYRHTNPESHNRAQFHVPMVGVSTSYSTRGV